MASWQAPNTFATGDDLDVASVNIMANDLLFLYQKPYALYYNSVVTSCSSGSNTQVSLGGNVASGYGFSVSSNNAIVPLAGVYRVSFSVELTYNSNPAVLMQSLITQNGTVIIQGPWREETYFPFSTGSGLIHANAGDAIALYCGILTSGTYITNNGPNNTFLHLDFVGSQ